MAIIKPRHYIGKRVVCFGAHPDDLAFRAGGSACELSDAGAFVTFVVATDGGSGKSGLEIGDGNLCALRRGEEFAAASTLGVAEVICLGFADGSLSENLPALRGALLQVIRASQADVVVSYHPTYRTDSVEQIVHPDHVAVGSALFDVVYPHSNSETFLYPQSEYGKILPRLPEIWVFGIEKGRRFHADRLRISRSAWCKKMHALQCYSSQEPNRLMQAACKMSHGERLRAFSRFAEGFTRLDPNQFGL
jgi:LmbE family N-acetylglucosaminyl deacetylase